MKKAKSGGGGGGGKGGKAKGEKDNGELKTCTHVKARHIFAEKQSKILEAEKRLKGTLVDAEGKPIPAMEFNKKLKLLPQVAEMMSEDKARDGGNLGWFPRGQMDGIFQEVVFNMRVGEVSAPFKSKLGWHIVKCEGRR